jgi:AcrR family transcriptional regulator
VRVTDVLDSSLTDEGLVVDRIVLGTIEAYRTLAFHEVDIAAVARTSGVDAGMVTRFFPRWDALLLVVYDRWTQLRGQARAGRPQPTGTLDYVRMTLREDIEDPGLVRVMAGAINFASTGQGTFSDLFQRRYAEYHQQLTYGLHMDFEAGREISVIPPAQAATQVLALYEGLQIQMLVRSGFDAVAEWDQTVRTLRDGWRRRPLQAWDLD